MEYLLKDTPISNKTEDIFNFGYYAEKVNTIIQTNTKNSEPIVIGIHGKWGDGKTSFMNLIKEGLSEFKNTDGSRRILEYDFNPWRYSTEDEMLFDFFDGLAKTLLIQEKDYLKKAGKLIIKFSRYLKAIKFSASIGVPNNEAKATFEPSEILKALGEDLQGEEVTLEKIKSQIDNELEKSDYTVAIFIDDIDRLDKNEIYTLLKIIKLNANFKNLIYIIALDPNQVAKAIHHRYGTDKEDGKLFLEKIINIPILLPKIEKEDLQQFFENNFKHITTLLNINDKKEEYKNILYSFNSLNLNSPREIKRVLNSFFISAFAIGEEVNLRDLFFIECLKIKNYMCYNEIKKYSREYFSDIAGVIDFNDSDSGEKPNGFRKKLIDEHISDINIINSLFPTDTSSLPINIDLDPKSFDRELRINSPEHFDKYFSYHPFRKISDLKIRDIKRNVQQRQADGIITIISELIKQNVSHENKVIYKIDRLIDEFEKFEERNFFFKTLLKNINIIPETEKDLFGLNHKIRLIEKIAVILKENERANKEIAIELGELLEYKNLCYFTRKFSIDGELRSDLYKIITDKVKVLSLDTPFYDEPDNMENKMLMTAWKETDPKGFKEYIARTLNKDNIKLLIRNFPPFWNNQDFGGLSKESYDYMKTLIDTDLIYKNLIKYYPKYEKNENVREYSLDDYIDSDGATIEENTLQFIYWYRKEKRN